MLSDLKIPEKDQGTVHPLRASRINQCPVAPIYIIDILFRPC